MKNFFDICVDVNAMYANFTESHLEKNQNFQSWAEMASISHSFSFQTFKTALIP